MKKISKLLALAIILLAMSCTSDIQGPLVDNGAVPQSIKINKVENLPGGSRVFYMLPDDPNVLYIRCEYTLPNGETKVVKGSTYSNFIELEGFGRSHEQEVKLYTVSRSEKSSEPVSVKIHPEPARIHEVFETLQVAETFGGVITSFTNASKSELVMYTLIKDEEGNWLTYDRLYTNALERNYSIRGLESESTEFGFYFTDKWNNNSDTLMRTMVPLYEKLIEKDAWKNAKLFNDTYTPQFAGAWDLENIWDGTSSAVNGFYHGHPSEPADLTIPNWFTIDLGNSYVFSRIRVNQMNHHPSFMYSAGADIYLTKPFSLSLLRSHIDHLVKKNEVMRNYFYSPESAYENIIKNIVHRDDKKLISALIAIIDEHIENPLLSPTYIADIMNTSPRSLYRKVKKITSLSLMDFIKDYKLLTAERLLVSTNLSVQEIMYKSGMSNKSYFYREFVKRNKVTPKQFRKLD